MDKVCLCGFIFWILFSPSLYGQDSTEQVPPIKLLRAEESYLFLKNDVPNPIFLKPLKLITVHEKNGIYVTLGGEYRARLESFTNRNYTTGNDTYYSQRLDFHTSLILGSRIRLFCELYHGYTSGEDRLLEDGQLDFHQVFLEIILHQKESSSMSVRLGRQEIGYGVSRLIGIREGPNIRRSYDLAKFVYTKDKKSINIIYGRELSYGFDSFDNQSNILDEDASNPLLWGVYFQNNVVGRIGNLDFYYFGFNSETALFNDVSGQETRHSVGIRSYGIVGKFSFNTELIYQFGEIGTSDISAYNFETDWKYLLFDKGWKPKIGIRLDLSSGDQEIGDGKIQTFNPLFVNPAIYSLAGLNTPANLMSLHPNFMVYPLDLFSIYIDYAIFYRTQANDALYTPPRFVFRQGNETGERHIGDVIGLQVKYEYNRNVSFDIRSSYFIAGKFIKATGESENTFYIAPTVSFKF